MQSPSYATNLSALRSSRRAAIKKEDTSMTKRFVSMALAIIMVMALLIPAALAGDEDSFDPRTGYYYVRTENGKGLNVRDMPNGKVVGSLKYRTQIYVEAFASSEWAQILYKYDNGFGYDEYAAYVSTRFLTRNDPGPFKGSSSSSSSKNTSNTGSTDSLSSINSIFRTARQVTAPYTVVARPSRASGWVNLRWAPSTEAERIATCPQGKRLTVLAEMNGWYQVQDNATGMIGFISSKYVERQ